MVGEYLAHRETEYARGWVCGGPACPSKTGRIAESTIIGDRAAAAAVVAGLGTRQADDPLARRAITEWLAKEATEGDRRAKDPGPLSSRAVAARASILRRAYYYAIADTQVLDMGAPPVPRVHVKYQKPGQAITPSLLAEVRSAAPAPYRVFVDTLIASGMRIGEVAGLNIGDFDPGAKTVTGGSKTAAGMDRVIHLPQWLVDEVVRMVALRYMGSGQAPDPGDPLFTNTRGGRVNPDPFRRRVWNPLVARVGLRGVTPHSLRHTLATRAAQQGHSVYDLMEHFGWSDPRQAKTYVHNAREGVAAMADLTADMRPIR